MQGPREGERGQGEHRLLRVPQVGARGLHHHAPRDSQVVPRTGENTRSPLLQLRRLQHRLLIPQQENDETGQRPEERPGPGRQKHHRHRGYR